VTTSTPINAACAAPSIVTNADTRKTNTQNRSVYFANIVTSFRFARHKVKKDSEVSPA